MRRNIACPVSEIPRVRPVAGDESDSRRIPALFDSDVSSISLIAVVRSGKCRKNADSRHFGQSRGHRSESRNPSRTARRGRRSGRLRGRSAGPRAPAAPGLAYTGPLGSSPCFAADTTSGQGVHTGMFGGAGTASSMCARQEGGFYRPGPLNTRVGLDAQGKTGGEPVGGWVSRRAPKGSARPSGQRNGA